MARRKPPLLWFGSFRRSCTGRRGESGALQQTDLRVDTRTPRTVDRATPAQMDIYFTLFSLFFFTQPGNRRLFANLPRFSQMSFFCCALTFLRTKRLLLNVPFDCQYHELPFIEFLCENTGCKNRIVRVIDTCSYLWVRAQCIHSEHRCWRGDNVAFLRGELIACLFTTCYFFLKKKKYNVFPVKRNLYFL